MQINALLKAEAKATSTFQGKFKSIIANAVKKHGLDKRALLADIEPKIKDLATKNVKAFLKMGVDWLK